LPPNGTFSGGLSGWADYGGEKPSLVVDTDVSANVLDCSFSPTTVTSGIESMPFPLPLSSQYLNFRGAFKSVSATAGDLLRVSVEYRKSPTGGFISFESVDFDATGLGGYTLKEGVFTRPANARWAVLRVIRQVASGDGYTFRTSTLQIEPNIVKTIAGRVGIGVPAPSEMLEVGGNVKATQVLASMTHIRAKTATAGSYVNGATIIFNTEDYDTLGEYDHTTGIWTCTQAGYYLVSANLFGAGMAYTATNSFQCSLKKNGTNIAYGYRAFAPTTATWYLTSNVQTTVLMDVGDNLNVYVGHDRAVAGVPTPVSLFADSVGNYFTIDRLV
jgi:hypothetical protein